MKLITAIRTFCLLLCMALTMPSHALSYDDIQARGVIAIAVYNDFPPYSFKDENGNAAGIDVELAKALAKGLDVALDLRWMTPDETVEDDMRNYLWKGMNLTSEDGQRVKADVMLRVPYDREFAMKRDDIGHPAHELVHMFAPYQQERWLMAYDAAKLDRPKTAARFMYHPVGVEVDTVPQFFVTTAYGGRFREKSRTYPSTPEAFQALNDGEVSIVMGTASQLEWLHHNNKNPQANEHLTELAFPLLGRSEWELGIAVHSNYRQLAYALEDIVMAHINNGDFVRWGEKFGVDFQLPERFRPEPEVTNEEAIAQTP
ncbi:Membrane-bound lytic murein transglycosylase F [Grimontia celer]|uniref:Membrane-bound lytic murein transglycosylase F n=1 Tax=Grimontia celer TaxID=1796497 RepID=A0A128FCT9_9GAMM|nr:ABC transporter substrate-binding protein [Grimontia celer]CZF84154.1 Membrane-bound lytic murein transglycosylase F [Grimontia celer]